MTFSEFKNTYSKANVEALILGYNFDNIVEFRMVFLNMMSEDEFFAITRGTDTFKAVKRNIPTLNNFMLVETITLEELEKYEGENLGYKAESFLFGKPNYSNSLIDGKYHGFNVQVKTSINSATSNNF